MTEDRYPFHIVGINLAIMAGLAVLMLSGSGAVVLVCSGIQAFLNLALALGHLVRGNKRAALLFLLSALLIPLIGLGACAVLASDLHV